MSTKQLPLALPDYDHLPPVNPSGEWKKDIYIGPYGLFWLGKGGHFYDIYGGSIYYELFEQSPWFIKFDGQAYDYECNENCSGRRTVILSDQRSGVFSKDVVVQSSSNDGYDIKGFCHSLQIRQSNSSITSYRWCYLNAPSIQGEEVARNGNAAPDRLVFISKKSPRELYRIILENQDGYQVQKNHREISHHCDICLGRDGSKQEFDNMMQEIRLFSRFVSFFSGTHHAPWFIEGMNGETPVSWHHECGYDTSMKAVVSWKPLNGDKDLVKLWPLFRLQYYLSSQRASLMDAVLNYYLDANDPTKPLVGAIASAISGLEALASDFLRGWRSVDDLLEIIDDNLRRHYNYDGSYSLCSSDLTGRFGPLPYSDPDAPDASTCLATLIQYLELTILYWLGYEGKYFDRVEKKNKRVKIVRT